MVILNVAAGSLRRSVCEGNEGIVILVTDYEEHQQAAVEAGTEHPFGKAVLRNEATREKLRRFLGDGTGGRHV